MVSGTVTDCRCVQLLLANVVTTATTAMRIRIRQTETRSTGHHPGEAAIGNGYSTGYYEQ